MALKIRLRRMGRKKSPTYRLVIAETTMPRDGRFVASIGHYNPRTEPVTLVVDRERALYWLDQGAMPTGTAKSLLKSAGVFGPAPTVTETAVEGVRGIAKKVAGKVRGAAATAGARAASASAAIADVAEDVSEEVRERVEDVVEDVRERVEDVVEEVRDRVDDVVEDIREAVAGDDDDDDDDDDKKAARAPVAEASAEPAAPAAEDEAEPATESKPAE